MTARLTIGVVTGVTPDKWVRVWRERMPDVPLTVVPVDDGDAAAAIAGGADMVFARLPLPAGSALHAIPLWEETPVAVAGKDHPVKVFDAVVLADLADEQRHEGWDEATLDVVAAGHGVVVMPQSVFRASGRRDLVARPVTDAPATRIALVWDRRTEGPEVDEFIGVVRGRTANSSRGAETPADPPPARPQKAPTKAGGGTGAAGRPRGGRPAPSSGARRPRRPHGRGRG